jgi:hypothetical protein
MLDTVLEEIEGYSNTLFCLVKKADNKMLLKSSKIKNIDKSQLNCSDETLIFENPNRLIVYEDVFYSNEALNIIMKYSPKSVYVDLNCLVFDLVHGKVNLTENVSVSFLNV